MPLRETIGNYNTHDYKFIYDMLTDMSDVIKPKDNSYFKDKETELKIGNFLFDHKDKNGIVKSEINFSDYPLAKFLEALVKWIIAHPFEAFMIALSLVVLIPVITSLLPLIIHSIVAVGGVIFKSLLLVIKLPFKLLITFLKPPKKKDKS